MHPASSLLLDNKQLWVLLIGAFVPLVSYTVNKVAPWTSETVKAGIQVLAAAIAGGLYTALETNVFGLNNVTLQLVGSAVVAALAAHHWLWKPAKVNTKFGATELTTVGE